MTTDEQYALIDRLFGAIPAGDIAAAASTYHPGIQVWHSHTNQAQGKDENLGVLSWMAVNVKNIRYEEVRRTPMESGKVVQEHVLRGTAPGGQELDIHACMVFTFAPDGRFLRLEEYLDSTQIAPLMSGAELG